MNLYIARDSDMLAHGSYYNPDRRALSLTPHFYLATDDPIMSLRSSPHCYPPGPDYRLYQAVRLETEALIQGINIQRREPDPKFYISSGLQEDNDYEKDVSKRRRWVPAGTLLLRAFNTASGATEGEWFALMPHQQRLQNLQRIEYVPGDEKVNSDNAFAALHTAAFQYGSLRRFDDRNQRKAHRHDIILLEKLGMIRPFTWVDRLRYCLG